MNIYVANLFSLIGASLLGYSTFAKEKPKMLWIQVFDSSASMLACFFSGSYTGMISSGLAGLRNFAAVKLEYKYHKYIAYIFAVVCSSLSIMTNTKGAIGFLPVIGSTQYTLIMGHTKRAQTLRYALLISLTLWFVHDMYMLLIPSMVMDVIVVGVCIYNIFNQKKTTQSKEEI